MKTVIENVGTNLVEAKIEIDAKQAQDAYDRACRKISEQINIAGFRKGKAPKAIVEKHVGVDMIKKEALDALLPKMIYNVIEENNFDLVDEPTIKSFDFEPGKECNITASFELRPEVKISAYKNLEIKLEDIKIPEDAMTKQLEYLADRHADIKDVEPRKTQSTDIITFDFEGSANGEAIQGGAAKNYTLDLAHSNFIPGFAEQLIDKDLETEFTINVKFPEQYHDEKLKGADAEFKITIHGIKEKTSHPIDDELAKKAGNFKTLDELKADIQKRLEMGLENQKKDASYDAIFNKILENTKMDIQNSIIDREKDALEADMKSRIAQQGGKYEDILAQEGAEKIQAELRVEAEKRVKNFLVIYQIARLENIQVTTNDLETKLDEFAKMYGVDKQTILKELDKNKGFIQNLSQQVINGKVSEFLLTNNKVIFE